MTLSDIEKMPKEILTAADIAPFLRIDPHVIRIQAHSDPKKLGFPVIVCKSRVKIPKEGFINYIRGDKHGKRKGELPGTVSDDT